MAPHSPSFSLSFYQDFDDDLPNLTCFRHSFKFTLHLDQVLRSPGPPPHHIDVILDTYTADAVSFPREDFLLDSAFAHYVLSDIDLPEEEVENAVPRLLTFVRELVNDPRNISRRVISVVVNWEITRRPGDSLEGEASEVKWKFEKFEVKGNVELAEHQCMICLEKFSNGDNKMGARLRCGHVYDNDCIRKWLNTNNICPICRHEVPEQEELEPNTEE